MLEDIKNIDNERGLTLKRYRKAKDFIAGFKLGEEAFKDGIRFKECPFLRGDPYRKGWRRGWKIQNYVYKENQKDLSEMNNTFHNQLRRLYKTSSKR